MAVSALEKAQEAARKEAEWRAGAKDRAAEVKERRMAQLAEVEAEEAAARAREASLRAEAEARAVAQRVAEEAAQRQAQHEAAAAAARAAEEAAKDPFGNLWTAERQQPEASRQPRLAGMSHAPGASTENGNNLGQRPVVRQSKIYRQNESGNA